MRRYRIASWTLLIHSIIDFTVAAPVDVRDIHVVHVNEVDVAEDRIAALQKRMDPEEEEWSSDLTSEHGEPQPQPQPPPPPPDSESESESDSDDSDGGEQAQQWEEEFQNYEPSDIEEESGPESDQDMSDQEFDQEESDHEQSPPPPPAPEHDQDFLHSPESQHPVASMYEDLWSKLLKGSESFRPRASTSGVVDVPKKELQETDDAGFLMVRDVREFLNVPATSVSSVVGRGRATSLYSAPGHSQNRKKWMLDGLD